MGLMQLIGVCIQTTCLHRCRPPALAFFSARCASSLARPTSSSWYSLLQGAENRVDRHVIAAIIACRGRKASKATPTAEGESRKGQNRRKKQPSHAGVGGSLQLGALQGRLK